MVGGLNAFEAVLVPILSTGGALERLVDEEILEVLIMLAVTVLFLTGETS